MWLVAASLLLPLPGAAAAQGAALGGVVRTAAGGPVVDASVLLRRSGAAELAGVAETNAQGRFRFPSLEPGRYQLQVQHLGYAPLDTAVLVGASPLVVTLVLREQVIDLPGVRVDAERVRARFEESAGVTAVGLRRDELKLLPGLAEADVLRAVEILPGVVSTSDYSSAYNVRGGSADQNLILLDGMPVYNPFHLGGLFSVFNADMIGRADLLAGGFPAEYGGRVSSVLQIESDAGPGGFEGSAGLSLLATRLTLGTSLPSPTAGALGLRSARGRVSLRRSYFDQLLRPVFDFPYHLTDGQLFAEAWTAGGSRIQLTGYTGRDVLDLAGLDDFPLQLNWGWGNDVAGAGWTHPLAEGRSVDARAGFSRFRTAIRFPEFADTEFRSEIVQWLARTDLELPLGGESSVRSGVEANHLDYDNLAATGGTVFREGHDRGWLLGAYTQAGLRFDDWLVEVGGRIDAWAGASADLEVQPAPRVALKRFLASGDVAVKLAAGRYTQFVHSLRDEELPLGIDLWVTSGAAAPVVVSDQLQGGVEAFLGSWQLAVEGYFRAFDGVTAQNNADDPNRGDDDLLAGTGRSYGGDVLVRRGDGRIRPRLSVSWLRARRTFPDALSAEVPVPTVTYAPVFDRRLDVDLTVSADVGRGVQLGARLNYGTGLPYTRPLGAYVYQAYQPLDGTRSPPGSNLDSAMVAVYLGPRNAERYPSYLRVDLGARKRYEKRWGSLTPYIDVLNLTNRRNVLFYFYEYGGTPAVRSGFSMFPLLPSFGLEVEF